MSGLHPTHARVLTYLRKTVTDAYCPTYRQIGAATDLPSTSQVSRAVHALAQGGWLEMDPQGRRSIRLSDPLAGKSTSELQALRSRIDAVLAGRAQ